MLQDEHLGARSGSGSWHTRNSYLTVWLSVGDREVDGVGFLELLEGFTAG